MAKCYHSVITGCQSLILLMNLLLFLVSCFIPYFYFHFIAEGTVALSFISFHLILQHVAFHIGCKINDIIITIMNVFSYLLLLKEKGVFSASSSMTFCSLTLLYRYDWNKSWLFLVTKTNFACFLFYLINVRGTTVIFCNG